MIQRTPMPMSIPMARRLARLDPLTRRSPGLAAAALAPDFEGEDVTAHLTEAMALALDPAFVAATLASDRPWALALGRARDLAALAVLIGVGAWAFAVLA